LILLIFSEMGWRSGKMKIIVCIKSVVQWSAEGPVLTDGKLRRTAEGMELNPFDRPALELALRLTEEHGGSVAALSMGPEEAADALYEALALGADRAVLACDRALAGSDTLATSYALAAAIRKLGAFDLLLFGTRTADSDTGQVGPQTAELLGLPLIGWAWSVKARGGGLEVERRIDGFREVYAARPPAALTVHAGAIIARDASLYGIGPAYGTGRIERLTCAELGLDPARIGEAGSPTRVVSIQPVTRERKCELIAGPAEEQADELVKRLVEKGLVG
jgi:electron transfer flavoprotein beta subunit